ncbi:FAD-dependent oxidoreductase [Amycolatopsis endophytica]|uniref:3-phenylpropionate/trans-cinnamate dioxygenase ferredoxin reductase subunit n=1 Tax=Amycolatopsis endophytica TaxID=860233 RepID=A0A853B9X8_9PSEU|nr:FAD-dependent oxidoreductase [Amycolatopsis endophytica]NYI91491.1 3-phenylpropionate/trans-cinnamate dioxygenase ferredoxin reductase subunit [Amycolatopsis endophytica]
MAGPGIVIVGAGECGTRAAFTLRELGCTDPVTLIGAEPAPPYERPPLSKNWTSTPICDRAMLDDRGIALLDGIAVSRFDPARRTVELAGGTVLGYDRLLLATGARARQPPPLGAPVRTLRTRADAAALRPVLTSGARIGVIGAGLIGLEVAASAVALGCSVTVVEQGPRAMGRAVPARIAAAVERRHRDEGVRLRFGTTVAALGRTSSGIDLAGDEVDVVVAGLGAVPETALAASGGLAVRDGIVVDGRFRTSAPGVFAAGDCCSFPHPLYRTRLRLESWRAAREHGAAAARAMLGLDDERYAGVPWFWSDQYELTLQVTGLPAAAVADVVRPRPDGTEIWFGLAADGSLVAAAGAGTGTTVARDIRLAELLIARRAAPPPAVLADPRAGLKSLLRAPEPARPR